MSFAEIETAVRSLSTEEQIRLYESLGERLFDVSEERRERWSQAMKEIDEGKFFTLEQVEELNRQLEARGL